jgi:hypothetical protein
MDYREMEGAATDAYRRRNYALCFSLLDELIETADARRRARALSLKAGFIAQVDRRRAPEGLILVEEALQLVDDHPGEILYSLVTGLALCYGMGDIGRAGVYEQAGHRLLHEHGADPDVRAGQFRLHLNLGLLASFRGEHATAYWHFVQGSNSLLSAGPEDGSDGSVWRLWLYLHTATTCLAMGRLPEAEEALQQVEKLAATGAQRVRWALAQVELLRRHGRADEASTMLTQLQQPPEEAWNAETRTRFLIARALVAQDLADIRGFHRHLFGAYKYANDHSLDFLLSEIQRIQRGELRIPSAGG